MRFRPGIAQYLPSESGSVEAQFNFDTNVNQKLTPQTITASGISYPNRALSRVWLACTTVAEYNQISTSFSTMQTFTWTDVSKESDEPYVQVKIPFTSSHMQNARLPAGGNLGMLDGHVEWRPFRQFVPRAGDGGPCFYY